MRDVSIQVCDTSEIGGVPVVTKRVLIRPRGLVNRRNGADMALDRESAIAKSFAITAPRGSPLSWAQRRGAIVPERKLSVTPLQKIGEMFGVVNGVDCATELGLTPHLIDPFDLAELLPRRRHQLFLLSLHDLRTERRDRSVAWIEIQFVQPVQRRRRVGACSQCVAPLANSHKSAEPQRVCCLLLPRMSHGISRIFLQLVLKRRSQLFGPIVGLQSTNAMRLETPVSCLGSGGR